MTPQPETSEKRSETSTIEPHPCDHNGCDRRAVVAMRFHDQPGHVHDCGPCSALVREWCDVAESVPLPCPWPHGDGQTWQDTPRELR